MHTVAVGPSAHFKQSLAAFANWFTRRENQLVCGLALLALLLHLLVVPYQDRLVADEQYYVSDARAIISGADITHLEHPSLGKLFIAAGISVFGDNPWGWRIPAIIFAVTSVVLFYFICLKLAGRLTALLASLFFIFEALVFNYSGVAQLDVFSLTFMLLAFLLYLRGRYAFSGIALALSALCKLTGLLGIVAILVHWSITKWRPTSRDINALLLSPLMCLVAFMLLMPLFDFAATREWLDPIARLQDMTVRYQTLTFESAAVPGLLPPSHPLSWILIPSYYYPSDYQFFAGISPTLWIMIVPSMVYMIYEFRRNRSNASLFVLAWVAATYLLWIPLVEATGRATYLYYFYPTVGAICLAIGFAMQRLWQSSLQGRLARYRRWILATIIGYLLIHLLWFLILTTVTYAITFLVQGTRLTAPT